MTRAERRRKFRDSWVDYYENGKLSSSRKFRRLLWKYQWSKFKDLEEEPLM